jgi:hypothetical protein
VTLEPRNQWHLYSPAPELKFGDDRPAWVKGICASTDMLGDESEFVHLPTVNCGNWQCGWLEGYIGNGCVVGAFFSGEKYIAVLVQTNSPELLAQPNLIRGRCVGAYQIPMRDAPRDKGELVSLFSWAFVYLRDRGLLGPHLDKGLSDVGA